MRFDVCYTKGTTSMKHDREPYDGILVFGMMDWTIVKSFNRYSDALNFLQSNLQSLWIPMPYGEEALVVESFISVEYENGESGDCVMVADWVTYK